MSFYCQTHNHHQLLHFLTHISYYHPPFQSLDTILHYISSILHSISFRLLHVTLLPQNARKPPKQNYKPHPHNTLIIIKWSQTLTQQSLYQLIQFQKIIKQLIPQKSQQTSVNLVYSQNYLLVQYGIIPDGTLPINKVAYPNLQLIQPIQPNIQIISHEIHNNNKQQQQQQQQQLQSPFCPTIQPQKFKSNLLIIFCRISISAIKNKIKIEIKDKRNNNIAQRIEKINN
eukprot:TRINITY_DN5543_c0_g3_i1.p2 TRINITY_DN5543_c0_g3~~TRINITY_DN5543_c0_g3_i1.p2  ORF type:complete len:229 (+),score=-26.71 TRINITY_DN5543_c0_g3_i1:50-736(+)